MAKKQASTPPPPPPPVPKASPVNKELANIKKEQATAAKESRKSSKELSELDKGRYKTNQEIKRTLKEIKDLEHDIFDVSKELNANEIARLGLQHKLAADKIKSLKNDQAAGLLARKDYKIAIKAADVKSEVFKLEAKALPHRKTLLESQAKLNKFQDKYKDSVSESLGFVDKIEGSIKEIPIVGSFLSKALGTDKLKEELEAKVGKSLENVFMKGTVQAQNASQAAVDGYDAQIDALTGVKGATGGVSEGMMGAADGAQGMVKGLQMAEGAGGAAATSAAGASAAMGPLLPVALAIAAAVMLIKKAFEIDAEITQFAKQMGVSKEEAFETHHHLEDVAMDTKVIGANLHTMTAASVDLNKALGTSRQISKEMLESQVLLTKQYGMTGEQAADFQQMSAGMGKTAPQMTQEIQRTASMYNKMTGDSVNFKDITADIAKTSRATTASYKGNVAALTKAAIQAKKIGMSLEDTAQVSSNLLSIEESLENEMKANVLTGKHMNMNAARQLALQGDTAGAAAEAVAQAGNYDELLQMAPYKQKAIADAAGLTVDQLMKAGELEKYSQALGGDKIKDMRDLTAEQLKQLTIQGDIKAEDAMAIEQKNQLADSQDKINALTDKLSVLFGKVAGPIAEIIDPLTDIITWIMPAIMPLIKFAFAPLLGVIDLVKGISKLFKGDITGGIKDIGSSIMKLFYAPVMLVWDLIAGFAPAITDGILAPFKKGWEIIKGVFSGEIGIVDALKSIGGAIIDTLSWPFRMVMDFIGDLFGFDNLGTSIIDGIVSIGADLFNGIKKPFMDAYDWIANLFVGKSPSKLGQGILDGIASIGSSLLDFITAPFIAGWDLITGLFSGDIGIIDALKSVGGAIFDTLTAPFTMIMDFIGGLFNVDNLGTMIVDGVKGIGSSIVDGIAGIGSSIVDGVTAPFNSAFDWVSDKASAAMDFLPSWLGGSDDEASEGGATATKVSDAQIDPSGGLVVSGQKGTYQLDKQDSIVAGTDLGKGASVSADTMGLGGLGEIANSIMGGVSSLIGGGSSAPATDNSEMVNILKQILAATSQPVSVNIGGKVIDEIEKQTTLRKTYNTKMDSAHGAF